MTREAGNSDLSLFFFSSSLRSFFFRLAYACVAFLDLVCFAIQICCSRRCCSGRFSVHLAFRPAEKNPSCFPRKVTVSGAQPFEFVSRIPIVRIVINARHLAQVFAIIRRDFPYRGKLRGERRRLPVAAKLARL